MFVALTLPILLLLLFIILSLSSIPLLVIKNSTKDLTIFPDNAASKDYHRLFERTNLYVISYNMKTK